MSRTIVAAGKIGSQAAAVPGECYIPPLLFGVWWWVGYTVSPKAKDTVAVEEYHLGFYQHIQDSDGD